jgi:cytochrome P450
LLTTLQYNGRDIDNLEGDIDARIADMLRLIHTTYVGRVMDISHITRFFTLDVLSTIAFGRPFGFMASNSDLWDYDKSTSSMMLMLEWVVNHPSFTWLVQTPVMQALASPKVTDKTGIGPVLGFARDAVAERFGPKPMVKRDMLGHFVSKGLAQLQCEAESHLQIVAGSDSTTTVLRSTLFLLVGTPVSYAKLRAEIDNAVRDGLASFPTMTFQETQKLPYLQAVRIIYRNIFKVVQIT